MGRVVAMAVVSLTFGWNVANAGPPTVVKTTPRSGATGVNPTVTEIRVEFDQAMSDRSWSWVGGGSSYPETTGPPGFETDHVAVLPVRLAPDHDYRLGINSTRYTNFVNNDGESAVPYVIEFRTGPWPEGGERPPQTPAPTVVRTVPQTGATGVDPTLAEITVEFDQAMSTTSWSWTQRSNDQFPHTRGPASFTSDKVAVLPVRLEPDHSYWISLNSARYGNFKGASGRSATPYVLEFNTGPWPAGVDAPPLPDAP